MGSGDRSEGEAGRNAPATSRIDGYPVIRRLEDLVRTRPLVAVAGAGALGAVLGGVLFSRLGRLALVAATAYVANGLWHRKGRLHIDEFIEGLSG
ncbi:MAG TPA: hypothetical protein VN894_18290 [Polyangiaceae bacterium]|nr:hypothetical protein [Polyangiaceae bacterium]